MDQPASTQEELLAEVRSLQERLARAEAALTVRSASEEQLRLFVEHAPAAIAMFNREMIYLRTSRRWLTDFNLGGQDVVGRSHYEVFPDLPERWKAAHQHCLGGAVVSGEEEPFPRADGTVNWMRWSVHPWHETTGAIGGVIIFSEDVTARKQAEWQLAEAQHRCAEALSLLDSLLRLAPVGFAFLDREFRYVRVNQALADMNGLPAADHLGRTLAEVVPDVWPQLEPLFRGLLASGEPVSNFELSGETAAAPGQPRHWLASFYPVRIGGEVVGVGVIVNEVTQQRLLEQQLQLSRKLEAVGTLAGGVAHDFNNMLQIIGGFSDLMLAKLQPADVFYEQVRQIKKAANRAAVLTQELLAFGRKQILIPQLLDPNALVSQAGKLLRNLLGGAIELTVILKPRLGRIEADPHQLEQALVSLALYARDAMPHGGKLTLETASRTFDEHYRHLPPGDYVLLQVADTSPGLDVPTLDRIFEPFFTTREFGQDTGIGLASVYGIVKQSGGYIYVASKLGRGTVFSIYLPQTEADSSGPEEDPAAGLPRGMETALLAVHDDLLRGYASTFLQAAGYQVLEAGRGDQALGLAAQHAGQIHLLIADRMLPRLSGQQLADSLATTHPDLKVLFLLDAAEEAPSEGQLAIPGRAYLQLPFTPTMLLTKVREVLDS